MALHRARIGAIGCALVLLLWPIPYLASPRWDVMVVDADGQPRKGANVRLVYQNYSVEVDSHEVTLQTDETGRALFPAQHSSANLAQRCLSMISAAGAGVHASSGRHAFVFVFGNGYEGSAVDENNVVHGLAGLSRHNVVNDCREMTCHD